MSDKKCRKKFTCKRNSGLHGLLIFAGLVLFSILFFVPAKKVEAKSYTIQSADFNVQLNEDGSALITEDWCMTFSGGTYSRYYKDIHTKVSDVEAFSYLTVESVTVDGIACEQTTDTESRPEYHYSLTRDSSDIRLAAYFRFAEGSHHIIFTYCLEDVVKNWNNEAAAFCYRFLGAEFETNVKDIQIRINAPTTCRNADWDVRFADDLSVSEIKDTQLVLWGQDRSGMVKVKVWLNPDAFDSLTYVDTKNADKDPLSFMDLLMRLVAVIAGLFALLLVGFGIKTSKDHKRMVEDYQNDSTKFDELIRYLPEELPLCEILASYQAPANKRIFYCLLLDFIRRGVLQPAEQSAGEYSSEDQEVNFRITDMDNLRDYEIDFLKALSGTDNPDMISEENLNEFLLSDAKDQSKIMSRITGAIQNAAFTDRNTLAKSRGVNTKEIKSDLEYLKTIIESRDAGHSYPDVYDIIYMMLQDLSGILDSAILTEMILRFGWSIGKGNADKGHLRDSERMTDDDVIRDVEVYAQMRGMDSYLTRGSSSVFTHGRGSSSISVHDRGISSISTHHRVYSPSEADRISNYFDGVVDRLEENFNSVSSSSSSSGSSCSSCSSCSGCGGGGAD